MNINSEFDFYKLKKWVKIEKIYWWKLVESESAISFLEKNINFIENENLNRLSTNPHAISILKKYPDKIKWNYLVEKNPNAVELVKDYLEKCINSISINNKLRLLHEPKFIEIVVNNRDIILDKFICGNLLPNLASKKNIIYLDLLDDFLIKYPHKLPLSNSEYFWRDLVENPLAIYIIKKYLYKLSRNCWQYLAENPNAISIIEENLDKLNDSGWGKLSKNPNAIQILKKHMDKIDWYYLLRNINAYELIEEYPELIKCYDFIDYNNFSVQSPIFEYDYEAIGKRCSIYKDELMQIALHPFRIESYLQQGIKPEDLDKYI